MSWRVAIHTGLSQDGDKGPCGCVTLCVVSDPEKYDVMVWVRAADEYCISWGFSVIGHVRMVEENLNKVSSMWLCIYKYIHSMANGVLLYMLLYCYSCSSRKAFHKILPPGARDLIPSSQLSTTWGQVLVCSQNFSSSQHCPMGIKVTVLRMPNLK